MKFIKASTIALSVLAISLFGFGDSTKSIYGYVSTGWLYSTGNNFLSYSTENYGELEIIEGALTVYSFPADKLKIGIQIYGSDRGDLGNLDLQIDWAYGDYRFNDVIGLRIGRVKTPIGLYNNIRDVESARPNVFLPQALYAVKFRNLALAVNGLSGYGNISTGDSYLEYEAFGGAFNLNPMEDGTFIHGLFEGNGQQAAAGISAATTGVTLSHHDVLDIQSKPTYIGGANLFYNLPFGLKLGGTYVYIQRDNTEQHELLVVENTNSFIPWTTGSVVVSKSESSFKIPWEIYGSLEYSVDKLLVAAEYVRRQIEISGVSISQNGDIPFSSDFETEGYYGLLSYQVSPKLGLSAYYSEQYENLDDRSGENFELATGQSKYSQYQTDIALSLRFNLQPNWILKVEGHHNIGAANAALFLNPEGLEEEWQYYAIKNTFVF